MNSIRTRLTVTFLILAAGPLLIVGLILIFQVYNAQVQNAVSLQREMAANLSSRTQSLIRNLEDELHMLIRIEDLIHLNPERRNNILSIYLSRQSAIDDLFLLDAGGRVLSSHSRLELTAGAPVQSLAGEPSFSIPMAEGVTYFGHVRFSESSGEPLMVMAVPLTDLHSGKPEGVIVVDVRLKEIWELVALIHPGQEGASFILDDRKRVIAHSNPSVVLRDTRFDPPDFDGVQAGLNGRPSVVVSNAIELGTQRFDVVVEGPVSETLAFAFQTILLMLAIVVAALLAAGGIGFLMVGRIVKPIEEVAATARAINAGDLSRQVIVTSRDELGVLADAFNGMTSQLAALINNLEKRVAERTAELAASNQELEAFAYSVSHDLRAPLRHIHGFLDLLKPKVEKSLDREGLRYMATIDDAARRMGNLIDDLLSFSRMGRQAMSIQRVDLASLVRDIRRELAPDTAERDIEWRIGDLPAVRGDASMLRIVLMNLVSNALKFTRHRPRARIEIGVVPDGTTSETVVSVRDNGAGFDMAYADKLFGVFQRLHHENEFEGTGIGLANVRRIITRHGGRTWASGELNQGAAFFFSLPGA